MSRFTTVVTAVLLGAAVLEAAALAVLAHRDAGRAWPALVPAGRPDLRGALQANGGTEAVALQRLQATGAVLTVEDVARGLLHLSGPEAEHPLTPDQRRALLPLVREAQDLRARLLEREGDLGATRAGTVDLGRTLLCDLPEEERAAVIGRRDVTSVGGVEAAYWAELAATLAGEAR